MTVKFTDHDPKRIPHFWRTAWRRKWLDDDRRSPYAEEAAEYASFFLLAEQRGFYNTGD